MSVVVCRGCCCGSTTKHPDVDHQAQVDRLAAAIVGRGRLWQVDCLGPCERSNIVVVRTAAGGRRWFGDVLAPADTEALVDWVAAGAPARAPARVVAREFQPDDDAGDADPDADADADVDVDVDVDAAADADDGDAAAVPVASGRLTGRRGGLPSAPPTG